MRRPVKVSAPPPSKVTIETVSTPIDEFVSNRRSGERRAPTKSISVERFDTLIASTEKLMEGKEWKEFDAGNFVAVYAIMHRHLYGALPAEVRAQYTMAKSTASRFLAEEFGGEPERMIEFVRWAWARERKREKQRRKNGGDDFRITWRYQFGKTLLTDYRVSLQRAGE